MFQHTRYGLAYLALLWAVVAWYPVAYLLGRWRAPPPLWHPLVRALVAALAFALAGGFLLTSGVGDDLVSGRLGIVLLAYGAAHVVVIGIVARGRTWKYGTFFTAALIWVEASATIIFVAARIFFKFGYL